MFKRLHIIIFSYLIIFFALAAAKPGWATKRWRKSVFSGCRGEERDTFSTLYFEASLQTPTYWPSQTGWTLTTAVRDPQWHPLCRLRRPGGSAGRAPSTWDPPRLPGGGPRRRRGPGSPPSHWPASRPDWLSLWRAGEKQTITTPPRLSWGGHRFYTPGFTGGGLRVQNN